MEYRLRSYAKAESYEKSIGLSKEPCMLSFQKTNDTQRGVMSCGHCIDPNNLFSYMYYCVLRGLYQIKCPFIDPVNPKIRCD